MDSDMPTTQQEDGTTPNGLRLAAADRASTCSFHVLGKARLPALTPLPLSEDVFWAAEPGSYWQWHHCQSFPGATHCNHSARGWGWGELHIPTVSEPLGTWNVDKPPGPGLTENMFEQKKFYRTYTKFIHLALVGGWSSRTEKKCINRYWHRRNKRPRGKTGWN